MKIYTKTGDKGKTDLYGGSRVSKTHPVLKCLGEIDELSSRIGMVCALATDYNKTSPRVPVYDIETLFLRSIQGNLQRINSYVANNSDDNMETVDSCYILELENEIDEMDDKTPTLTKFILPGVTKVDAQIHLCRSQTRKVERLLWELIENGRYIDKGILKYINRLSDYFFGLSRYVCIYLIEAEECYL